MELACSGDANKGIGVLRRIGRLFVIKNRFEAYLIIVALALGAMTRGVQYTRDFPGFAGYLLWAATAGAVFMGGAAILDAIRYAEAARILAEAEAAARAMHSPGDRD